MINTVRHLRERLETAACDVINSVKHLRERLTVSIALQTNGQIQISHASSLLGPAVSLIVKTLWLVDGANQWSIFVKQWFIHH